MYRFNFNWDSAICPYLRKESTNQGSIALLSNNSKDIMRVIVHSFIQSIIPEGLWR